MQRDDSRLWFAAAATGKKKTRFARMFPPRGYANRLVEQHSGQHDNKNNMETTTPQNTTTKQKKQKQP